MVADARRSSVVRGRARRANGTSDAGSRAGVSNASSAPGAVQAVGGVHEGGPQLADIQRARILSGMFDVATERGAGNVTVADVVERSGVSRRTFYEFFEDREECFLTAIEQAMSHLSERVLPAYQAPGSWREKIRAGLLALLGFLDDEPVIGRLLIAESLAAGAPILERRARMLAHVISAVDAGREELRTGSPIPAPLTAEGVVGGVLAVIHARVIAEEHESFRELLNPLMSMIVAPYLGGAAARREFERPTPIPDAPREHAALLQADLFKGAGMRLTYRTVQVLMTIAGSPQCSNRAVGDGAGIKDQGQISKLLARLERVGLVFNTGLGPGQGAPNAWSLTPRGEQVAGSIRAHTNSANGKTA